MAAMLRQGWSRGGGGGGAAGRRRAATHATTLLRRPRGCERSLRMRSRDVGGATWQSRNCLLYTSPSPRD
eukprot:5715672-Alexandrium_andersonii.AAC.1